MKYQNENQAQITNKIKIPLLFMAGGTIYAGIEVLVREFTHISMFIVGGLCFLLIGSLKFTKRDIPVTVQMLISSLIITLLELISGLIVNVWLGLDVWDYSHEPANLMGQICLNASAIWVFLSFVGIYADYFARRRMFGDELKAMRILP
jgi:uncharacterized membrane protein